MIGDKGEGERRVGTPITDPALLAAIEWLNGYWGAPYARPPVAGSPEEQMAIRVLAAYIAQPDAWLPIETAPKDGTAILGSKAGGRPLIYFYRPSVFDRSGPRFGFHGARSIGAEMGHQPTQWMPLPSPPSV